MHTWPAYAAFADALRHHVESVTQSGIKRPAMVFHFSWHEDRAPEIPAQSRVHKSAHQILDDETRRHALLDAFARAQDAFRAHPAVQSLFLTLEVSVTAEDLHGSFHISRGKNAGAHTNKTIFFGSLRKINRLYAPTLEQAHTDLADMMAPLLNATATADDPVWAAYSQSQNAFMIPFRAPDYQAARDFVKRHFKGVPSNYVVLPVPPQELDRFWLHAKNNPF